MCMKKVVLLQGDDADVERILDEFFDALNAPGLVAGRMRPPMACCIACGKITVSLVAVVVILLPLALEKMIRRAVINKTFLRGR